VSEEIAGWVAVHPPRCLGQFALGDPTIEDGETIRFRLSSATGESAGTLFGYSLARLDSDYSGDLEFVSPLSVVWAGTDRPALLLDTNVHGYHGEMDASSKLRGEGEPEAFVCSSCRGSQFRFEVRLHYWGAAYDLWEDEPELPVQDYFNLFTLIATCNSCRRKHTASDLDL
jgi:hypothetical protein